MLFKILHGDESRISTDITPFHEGWAYVTKSGNFYIDMNIGTVEFPNNQRIKINAKDAETLGTHAADEFLLSTDIDEVLAQAKASGEFDGADGVSVTHIWNGTTLMVTSASGTSSANLKGDPGTNGIDGVGVSSVKQTTTSTADDGNNVITITLTNGTTSTFTVQNGSKGSTGGKGDKGDAGYTPVRGTDYWTEADKNEMKAYIRSYIEEVILGGAW